MKLNTILKTTVFCMLVTSLAITPAFAQSNSKGPNSPIVVGTLTSFDEAGKHLTVQTKDAKRELKVTDESKLEFVGMPEKSTQKLSVGYGAKGKVDKDGTIKSLIFTLPIPEPDPLGADRIKKTAEELYKMTDQNSDNKVSYQEFSVKIYLSEKHGPDKFKKYDKDKNGTFNLKEFSGSLAEVSWWKMSRKTPVEWIRTADTNKDGKLSLEEFTEIAPGKNHAENHFKRTDKDKSGSLDAKEATAYINSVIGIKTTLEK